ncbi:MAG: hypothetical protein V4636_01530 [Pseudomonadota bacterium]
MQTLRSSRVRWLLFGLLMLAVVLPPLLAGGADVPVPPRNGIHDTPQKANGSGIRVRYRADGLAVVGQPFAVTLYFDAVSDPAATLRMSTDAGLQMSMSAAELPLSLGSSELALTVVPSVDGLAYLNVFTAQLGAGGVTSIPVQTGAVEPRLPARGELKSDADGEPVITFKVP